MPVEMLKAIPSGRYAGTLLTMGALLIAAMAIDATQARAGDLVVKYDQSQILRLPRPAAEIIIGNPTIADVSIQGGNLLVVTGKSFGITNIIVLDGERNVIQDQRVTVERDQVSIVHLTRGDKRHSYTCTHQCNPTITIGDDKTFFEGTADQSGKKMKFSEGGGGDTGQPQQ